MKDICIQCKFSFNETSVQFYRRLKNNSEKICSQCQRINNAEKSDEKRKKIKSLSKEEELKSKAIYLNKIHGNISAIFLARKFKISIEDASKIINKLN